MKKKTYFKKTATTFMLTLPLLAVLAGKQPIAEPVPDTAVLETGVDEEAETRRQSLSDDEIPEDIKE